jgi:hypothetical protein
LLKGEAVTDDVGKSILFGDAVLEHWQEKPFQEQKARLSELDDAQNAVRKPHEVWRQPGGTTVYLRKFQGFGPTRWMAVFVPNDRTKTYYSSERVNKADDSFRRGTLMRKR